MTTKVLLRAPLLTNSGYGVHSRQVFSWLYHREDVELTVECLNWGRTSWVLDGDKENGLYRKIMSCSNPVTPGSYDVSFQVILPDEWNTEYATKNVGVTALVETDRCTARWVEKCNKMDVVVLPSQFTLDVLKRSGPVTTETLVIPEWFNGDLLDRSKMSKTQSDKRYDTIKTDFNVLTIGALTSLKKEDDRKNTENTLKWLFEEFSDEEDVGVVIKTTMGKGSESDKQLCRDYLKSAVNNYRKGEFPKVYLIHGNMDKEEVAGLVSHRKIKLYATATRGEGYGLPLVEAAAAGVPIVATGWSGHLQFLQKENFGVVDYDLVEISETKVDERIFKKGFKWAEPSEESFKREVRKAFENYEDAKAKAKNLKKHIQFNYNSAIIKKQYDKLLEKVLEK